MGSEDVDEAGLTSSPGYVDWAGADDPFGYLTVQQLRTPLPDTAVGRVLLAYLPDRDRHELVSAECGGDPRAGLLAR